MLFNMHLWRVFFVFGNHVNDVNSVSVNAYRMIFFFSFFFSLTFVVKITLQ